MCFMFSFVLFNVVLTALSMCLLKFNNNKNNVKVLLQELGMMSQNDSESMMFK